MALSLLKWNEYHYFYVIFRLTKNKTLIHQHPMKSLKKLLLALFLACFSLGIQTQLQAQNFTFKVMASNGVITSLVSKKRLWAGSELNRTETILVPAGGYVGLMHKSGRTIEIKQAGNYKVTDLDAKIGVAGTLSNKYATFVAGEMTKADKIDINQNHRKYSSITGSVSRRISAYNKTASAYMTDDDMLLFNKKITLHLFPTYAGKADTIYLVRVLDPAGNKELDKFEIPANKQSEAFVDIDFSKYTTKYKIEEEANNLKIEVSFKGFEETQENRNAYSVSFFSGVANAKNDAKYKKNAKELAQIKTDSALDNIIKASIFEKNGFILDAINCYETTLKLAPEVGTYQVMYVDFLVKHKIRYAINEENPVKDSELLKEGAKK